MVSSAVSSAQGMFCQESASLQEEYSVNETSKNARYHKNSKNWDT